MTFELKYEPIEKGGITYPKYNIYYTGGPFDGLKEFHSTDGINGTIKEGYINVNAPNWKNLEQALRYAHDEKLFNKAFTQATDKGFNLFTTTLVNGKSGEASQRALAFAFANLGVTWEKDEKDQINEILIANNFTIQI